MLEAAFWGFVAASALMLGAELAFRFELSRMAIGLVMAFGVGTLIASVAFELVGSALEGAAGNAWVVPLGLALGAIVFFLGDRFVEGMGSASESGAGDQGGAIRGRAGMGIALGAALDGVPESVVLGMSLAVGGGVSVAFLVAVWISNLPESLAASVDMRGAGRSRRQVRRLWLAISGVSALAAAVGYAFISSTGLLTGAAVQAFAAGALLTMIADEMAPEAFGRSALYTGLATTAGFVLTLGLV